jgi:hypothetical protein
VNGIDHALQVGFPAARPWPSTAEEQSSAGTSIAPAASKPKFNDAPIISSVAAVESRGVRVLRKTPGDVDLHTRRSASGFVDCGKH